MYYQSASIFWIKILDALSLKYSSVFITGNFNRETHECDLKNFCEFYNLRNLVKQPFFLKKLQNTSFVDLLLINIPQNFCSSCLVERGLSYFHKMTPLSLKENLQNVNQKLSPLATSKIFSNEAFRQEVLSNINTCNKNYNSFKWMLKQVINLYVPQKRKPRILS